MFDPITYGAKGDGTTDDTIAVRAALAALASNAGGQLLLRAGYTFLTGPLNLTSNTVFTVAGTLLASTDSSLYPLIPPLPWFGGGQDAPESGQPEWQPVLLASYQSNITINGGGLIDGNGQAWWDCFHATPPLTGAPCNGYSRPQLLRPVHVSGFTLANITLRNSPAWTVHLANVTGAHLYNFTVTAPANQGNTDGVDIDCSRSVLVEDFLYKGGDDAIAVKAGLGYLGWTYGSPTQDVLVQRMTVLSGNGFAVGSEMSAGVSNVTFRDVVVNCSTSTLGGMCKHGLYIKTARGRGGYVHNVSVVNSLVSNVGFGHGITLQYTGPQPPVNATATPHVAGISILNTTILSSTVGFDLVGLDDSVVTGMDLQYVTLGPRVGACRDCEDTRGVCGSGVVPGQCPPCLTPTLLH